MEQYFFSVITPFHNTNLTFFKKSYESILNQTIGFQKIQYIIVFHNTKAKYIKSVKAILGKYKNVLFKEINNSGHSPSSPRNLGLKYAAGKYISFLDSDDYFSSDCLEKVYHHMSKTKSEIASVRRAIDLENPNLPIFGLLFLFNNVEKEIIIHRNNWDQFKMFSGHTCYPVTSCFYKSNLLKNNKIYFDEAIVYGEDILFNLECYNKAQIVSYLPQLIGYNYFMHTGSILQTIDRPREFVIEMAKGCVKLFDKTIAMGIDTNDILNNLLFDLARAVIFSSTLTEEDRYYVKKLVEKYVAIQKPMNINKLNDKELAFVAYMLPRFAFLYPETMKNDTYRKMIFNHGDTLMHIIENNKNTDFGEKYQFKNIRTIEAFQEIVPLTTYENYVPLVELQTKVAESNLFCSMPPRCYVYPEANKDWKFPLNDSALEEQVHYLSTVLDNNHTMIIIEQGRRPEITNDRMPAYTFSQALLMEYILKCDQQYGRVNGKLTMPYSLSLRNYELSHEDYIYSLSLFMLGSRDFNQIVTSDLSITKEVFNYIRNHYGQLIHDIKVGHSHLKNITPNYFNELKLYHKPNPERARELEILLKSGFKIENIKQIWPNLTKLVASINFDYKIKDELYRLYIDINRVRFKTSFVSNFYGVVATTTNGQNAFQFVEGNNFYEFLPLTKNAKPLLISELEKNKCYRLIITNHNGLYRYLTNLIIKIVTINQKECKFEILH